MGTELSEAPPQAHLAGRASVMLVLVTLLWSMSFPWTKTWQHHAQGCPGGELLASLTLIGLRVPLAVVILAIWQPRLFLLPAWREHAGGVLLGVSFFAGFILQTLGLAWTTPALSAFFTSLSSAWVPLVAWVFLRVPTTGFTLLGLGVGLAGTAVLVEGGWKLGPGETLTLIASVIFAVQLLLLDRLGRRLRPGHLTAGFLGIAGVLGLLGAVLMAVCGPGFTAWWGWTIDMLHTPVVLRVLLYQAVLPTVLAFHWMNVYQPRVPPSRAALIYLLEPVFTSVFSVWWGYDQVTPGLLLGGGLILGGNLLVELPRWLRGPRSVILQQAAEPPVTGKAGDDERICTP
jgi:drug/metabolite transporter (DMT)-like permease